MKEAGEKFDPKVYIPAIAGYYSTRKGEMLSFPFNSTAVIWYNRDAFKKAGVDKVPEDMARGVHCRGQGQGRRDAKCGFTNGWQAGSSSRSSRPGTTYRWPPANGIDGRRSSTSTRRCTKAHRQPRQLQRTGLRLRRPTQHREGRSLWRMPDLPRARPPSPTSRRTPSSTSATPRCRTTRSQGGAAELDHRRCLALGDGRQAAAHYKGVAKFFSFLSGPTSRSSDTRRPAICRSPWPPTSKTKESGFYKENPSSDVSARDDRQEPPRSRVA